MTVLPALPTEIAYGFVTGRFLLAVRDGADAGRYPDGVPAIGTVTFTPLAPIRKTSAAPPATVIKRPITCDIGGDGLLVLPPLPPPAGEDPPPDVTSFPPGVWLTTGQYNVTYDIAGSGLRPHDIEVTAAHTEAAPLDLTLASPPQAQLDPTQWSELNARMDALAANVGTYDERIDGVESRVRPGAGSPQGVVTAAPGTRYVDTAATFGASEWFKLSGTGTSGWVVVVGDTGLVDVTASALPSPLTPVAGDSVTVRRSTTGGVAVTVNLAARASWPDPLVLTLPAWARPSTHRGLASVNGGVPSRMVYASGGDDIVRVYGVPAAASVAFAFTAAPSTSATPWRTA